MCPTDVNLPKEGMIYQREQYAKGGIGKKYWLFKDEQLIKYTQGKKTIVDIGCGEGILLEKLMQKYPAKEIIGIDAEKENIEICKKYGLNVIFGSAYNLPLKDNSIDCIILAEVIEHLDQPSKAIGEIHRVLKKNGMLIMLFPNDLMFLVARLLTLKVKEAFYDTGHVKQWSPQKARKFLSEHNFSISLQQSIPFFFWHISLHHLTIAKKVT